MLRWASSSSRVADARTHCATTTEPPDGLPDASVIAQRPVTALLLNKAPLPEEPSPCVRGVPAGILEAIAVLEQPSGDLGRAEHRLPGGEDLRDQPERTVRRRWVDRQSAHFLRQYECTRCRLCQRRPDL